MNFFGGLIASVILVIAGIIALIAGVVIVILDRRKMRPLAKT
jgi:hypothetical protein